MFLYFLKASSHDMTNYVKQQMLDKAYGVTADIAFRNQWFPGIGDRDLAARIGAIPQDPRFAERYRQLVNLPPPLDLDPLGAEEPGGGNFDQGAQEEAENVPPPEPAPLPIPPIVPVVDLHQKALSDFEKDIKTLSNLFPAYEATSENFKNISWDRVPAENRKKLLTDFMTQIMAVLNKNLSLTDRHTPMKEEDTTWAQKLWVLIKPYIEYIDIAPLLEELSLDWNQHFDQNNNEIKQRLSVVNDIEATFVERLEVSVNEIKQWTVRGWFVHDNVLLRDIFIEKIETLPLRDTVEMIHFFFRNLYQDGRYKYPEGNAFYRSMILGLTDLLHMEELPVLERARLVKAFLNSATSPVEQKLVEDKTFYHKGLELLRIDSKVWPINIWADFIKVIPKMPDALPILEVAQIMKDKLERSEELYRSVEGADKIVFQAVELIPEEVVQLLINVAQCDDNFKFYEELFTEQLIKDYILLQDTVPGISDVLINIAVYQYPDPHNDKISKEEILTKLKLEQVSPLSKQKIITRVTAYLEYFTQLNAHLKIPLTPDIVVAIKENVEKTHLTQWLMALKGALFTDNNDAVNLVKDLVGIHILHLTTALDEEEKRQEALLLQDFLRTIKFETEVHRLIFKQKIQNLNWVSQEARAHQILNGVKGIVAGL